jgi:hypothetical protein
MSNRQRRSRIGIIAIALKAITHTFKNALEVGGR